jgi:hypothetical protein
VTIKDDILSAEDAGWHEIHVRLAKLSDEDWTKPGPNGTWSAKDIVAHLACWHAETSAHLESIRMTGNDTPWPGWEAFNEMAYERCAGMSLQEVRAMSGAARHRFREEVAAVAPVALSPRLLEAIRWSGELHYRGNANERGHIDEFDELVGAL